MGNPPSHDLDRGRLLNSPDVSSFDGGVKLKSAVRTLSALAALTLCAATMAQTYPARPVRVIVPLAAGSLTDVIMRTMAPTMSARLNGTIAVENLPGAGGVVGSVAAKGAAPDGYTMLVATSGAFSINPHLHKSLPYDPVKNFTPVCRFGGGSFVLAVNPSLGVKTLPELLAKAKTTQLSFASSGLGSTPHMAQEMFKARVGVPFVHVPYKGAGQAITDTIAGHAHLLFETPGPLIANIRSGTLIPIGILSARRLAELPDVPTLEELGYAGLRLQGWVGLVAPAGTPAAIVNRVAEACQAALGSPEVLTKAQPQGFDIDYAGPAEFTSHIASELPRWGELVRLAGVKSE